MMQDVNTYEDYTFSVSDENWLKFCEFFNTCVMDYGSITKELHYFRLKLNRTYKQYFKEKKFTSTNPRKYPSYQTYGNEYNMKFVDIYGMNEVVVTPDKDLTGMSDSYIIDYLKNPEHWLILTDDYEKASL